MILNLIPNFCLKHPFFAQIWWKLSFCLAFEGPFSNLTRTDTNLDTLGEKRWYRYWYRYFLDWNFDTDTDMILSYSQISILIRYRYDTFLQKSRNFDTDTIVSKGSALRSRADRRISELSEGGGVKPKKCLFSEKKMTSSLLHNPRREDATCSAPLIRNFQ